VDRTLQASQETGLERIAVVGGVAANSELRSAFSGAALAPLPLCTDNAVMIASAARYSPAIQYPQYLALDAYATAA
jgi:tRNA N6-adenosine threonylcarbamoyltransferase